jgi:hypothetical protein
VTRRHFHQRQQGALAHAPTHHGRPLLLVVP